MTTDLSKTPPPAVNVTEHPAPGACTVPGHEGDDATVLTVTDADDPTVTVTVTYTPWRTEYTYAAPTTPTTFVTVTDPAEVPPPLQAAALAAADYVQRRAGR